MKIRLLAAALVAASLSATAVAEPVTYTIDPSHTQIAFTYSHMGFSNITGRFDSTEGMLTYDPENPTASSIEITTQIASVSTGVAKLDEHLKNADFFDAGNFPTATFKSTKVEAAGEGKLSLTGDLTIHGVTVPTSFDVTINKSGDHPMVGKPAAGFDATGSIDRVAFGIDKYLQATGPAVHLAVTIEAIAQ
ncbi:YceI family protein [Xanthomonadaceae bacterium JHOS43]|nr:YceI family protein [Xanthomonadaceae bacterium JHOS43]